MSHEVDDERFLIALPVAVADDLIAERLAAYPRRHRGAIETLTAAVVVLGATSDTVSLALARESVADALRRVVRWSAAHDEAAVVHVSLSGAVEVEVDVTGADEQAVLDAAAQIIEVLRRRPGE